MKLNPSDIPEVAIPFMQQHMATMDFVKANFFAMHEVG